MERVRKVFIGIIVLFLFFSLSKNIFDYKKTTSFYESFKKEYEKEKKDNISLKTEILKNNDVNEQEKIIRDKLNLLKDGEIAVIIPKPTRTPTPPKKPVLAVYQQWLQVFFRQ